MCFVNVIRFAYCTCAGSQKPIIASSCVVKRFCCVSHKHELQDEEEGFLEKDELPSAQEQMGLYRPLQNRNDGQDMDAAALDEYVRERFVAPSQSYAEVDDTQASEVGQQGLQPTPQDPKLWLVECKTGSEREAVVSLMQKCVDLAMKGTPLAVKAVFTQDHLKVGP